jgi:hypothetical protein
MMSSWDEVRKKYPDWKFPLWQFSSGGTCAICGIKGEETPQEFLVIVEGDEERYCKMHYFAKYVDGMEDITDDELWQDGKEYHIDDLPPEVIPPDPKGSKITDW